MLPLLLPLALGLGGGGGAGAPPSLSLGTRRDVPSKLDTLGGRPPPGTRTEEFRAGGGGGGKSFGWEAECGMCGAETEDGMLMLAPGEVAPKSLPGLIASARWGGACPWKGGWPIGERSASLRALGLVALVELAAEAKLTAVGLMKELEALLPWLGLRGGGGAGAEMLTRMLDDLDLWESRDERGGACSESSA